MNLRAKKSLQGFKLKKKIKKYELFWLLLNVLPGSQKDHRNSKRLTRLTQIAKISSYKIFGAQRGSPSTFIELVVKDKYEPKG